MECDLLPVISYPMFPKHLYYTASFSCQGRLILLYIVIIVFSVCSLFWFNCQYLPSERLL